VDEVYDDTNKFEFTRKSIRYRGQQTATIILLLHDYDFNKEKEKYQNT